MEDLPEKKRPLEECVGEAEGQTGRARITSPAELHSLLSLPIPAFTNALEPIPVTAATFCSSLRPAFALGVVPYRVQIAASRCHKKVAFFEVTVLSKDGPGASRTSHSSFSPAYCTLTQLVVDMEAVGEKCFAQTPSLCLGDVLDVSARWIWDPKRAHPLNLAASHFLIVSRWDDETVVALRKGGFHKVREPLKAPDPTREGLQSETRARGQEFYAAEVGAMSNDAGSRAPKIRGVIRTKRVQEGLQETISQGNQNRENRCVESQDAIEAHGRCVLPQRSSPEPGVDSTFNAHTAPDTSKHV